jgi:hypothetical protein
MDANSEKQLDEIVDKCAAFMHGYFLSEKAEHTDYDIVSKFISDDDWTVILRPNYMPNRLMEFYKQVWDDAVTVYSYIEDNELQIKI